MDDIDSRISRLQDRLEDPSLSDRQVDTIMQQLRVLRAERAGQEKRPA